MTRCTKCNDTGQAPVLGSYFMGQPVYLSCDCKPTCNKCGKVFSRSKISATSPTCESYRMPFYCHLQHSVFGKPRVTNYLERIAR